MNVVMITVLHCYDRVRVLLTSVWGKNPKKISPPPPHPCAVCKFQQIIPAVPPHVPVVRIPPRVAGSAAQAFPAASCRGAGRLQGASSTV